MYFLLIVYLVSVRNGTVNSVTCVCLGFIMIWSSPMCTCMHMFFLIPVQRWNRAVTLENMFVNGVSLPVGVLWSFRVSPVFHN